MSSITWLHLSDLHMNSFRFEHDRQQVQSSLLEDLRSLRNIAPPADLIFFTGDLAFGHTPEESIDTQLDSGFAFLDDVRRIWAPELPKTNVFLVPGNHDVRRDFVTEAVKQFLEAAVDARKLALILKRRDRQWEQIVDRLKPYADALRRNGYEHLLHNPLSLNYLENRRIRDISIDVCGLNTAWSCAGDREKGKLWFCGKWQVAEVTKEPRAKLSVCLMHHPLGWFREEEDIPTLDRTLGTTFSFVLHGHEHDEWITSAGDHTRIAAGACYAAEDADNGYNLTSYDVNHCRLTVRLRRYEKRSRRWVQNIIPGKTDNSGSWHVPSEHEEHRLALLNGTQPISTALASAKAKAWDAFLAVPMAALSPEEYQQQRRDLRSVLMALRRHWGKLKIYYPAEHITGPDKWDPADMAMIRGLKAVSNSRIFLMIYSVEKPSSILVEAGFALAHGIPSIYFVKTGLKLPFLLKAASQAVSDVKVYPYTTYADIIRILKEYREELVDFMQNPGSRAGAPHDPPSFTEPTEGTTTSRTRPKRRPRRRQKQS